MDENLKYDAEFAIYVAKLWRAGKLIGADEDAVRNALLDEIDRLNARINVLENTGGYGI